MVHQEEHDSFGMLPLITLLLALIGVLVAAYSEVVAAHGILVP